MRTFRVLEVDGTSLSGMSEMPAIEADSVTFEPGFVVFRRLDGSLVMAAHAARVLMVREVPPDA